MGQSLRALLVGAIAAGALAQAADASTLFATADTTRVLPQGSVYVTYGDIFTAAGMSSTNVKAVNSPVVLAIGGAGCTSLSGQLQRTDIDPSGQSQPVNAGPSTGTIVTNTLLPTPTWIAVGAAQSGVTSALVTSNTEPTVGFYRYNVTAITGTCTVSISAAQR
jgi:hypothetical protein